MNPPAAAARDPLSMVSACSKPGSRRCTCMSMKPGATIMPRGVEHLGAPATTRFGADAGDAAVHDQHVGHARRVRDAGSITRPFLMSRSACLSNHLFEHRHAHRDAVLHLIQNHRPLEIRDLATKARGPRLIGPGCITMASGLARSRCSSRSP